MSTLTTITQTPELCGELYSFLDKNGTAALYNTSKTQSSNLTKWASDPIDSLDKKLKKVALTVVFLQKLPDFRGYY